MVRVLRAMDRLLPILALLLACSGCDRRLPQPSLETHAAGPADNGPPELEPEPARIPAGCEVNLSGTWRLARKAPGRYRVEDDGVVARIAAEPGTEEGPVLVLERTARGFSGEVHAVAATETRNCPMTFAAQVVSCRGGELVLRMDDSRPLHDDCVLGPPGGLQLEWTLVREGTREER